MYLCADDLILLRFKASSHFYVNKFSELNQEMNLLQ